LVVDVAAKDVEVVAEIKCAHALAL
jgi:hypothetical protein